MTEEKDMIKHVCPRCGYTTYSLTNKKVPCKGCSLINRINELF